MCDEGRYIPICADQLMLEFEPDHPYRAECYRRFKAALDYHHTLERVEDNRGTLLASLELMMEAADLFHELYQKSWSEVEFIAQVRGGELTRAPA